MVLPGTYESTVEITWFYLIVLFKVFVLYPFLEVWKLAVS